MSDKQILALLQDESAPLIACGHTHSCMDRTVERYRIINVGSISLGWNLQEAFDNRAWRVLLDWQSQGWQVQFRAVDYNHMRVWQAYEKWELWPVMQEYAEPRGWAEAVHQWALRQAAQASMAGDSPSH